MKYIRNTTHFGLNSRPGKLALDVFSKINRLPGFFNFDDCCHFHLILAMQTANGMVGDILEIGSYHGRSTSLLAYHLKADEKLVVCDTFDMPTGYKYTYPPSVEILWSNLLNVNPSIKKDRVIIHKNYSNQLELDPQDSFRFAHVDGGHSYDTVLGDVLLCADKMMSGGIIAIDDYDHWGWPEVTKAVDDFLNHRDDYSILADLNRHGDIGRKIYLRNNK